MAYQAVFQRYEMKYLLTVPQYHAMLRFLAPYMRPDDYGKSTVCNLYFDTPNFLLVRRSLERPVYKEKLRLRSYGVANADSEAFVELKKKFKKVVYKRRVVLPEARAMGYLCRGEAVPETQITREIGYALQRYAPLAPKVFLSYEREAFYAKEDHDFRVTFDRNILWRDYDLSLCSGIYGTPVLRENQVLMEVKTAMGVPMWLARYLSANGIFHTSFSKYGTAYLAMRNGNKGGLHYA